MSQAPLYHRPADVQAALDALRDRSWTVLAGGTDVFPAQVGRPRPEAVLDITALDELRGISGDRGRVRLGALTTWTDVVEADLPAAFRGLQQAGAQVGSVQVQNAGTVAGNLVNASPAADGVPPLLTLEAEVELRAVDSSRTLPLAEFITGYRATARRPDELVTAVLVPEPADGTYGAFEKLGSRAYLVISIVMVAVAVQVGDGAIEQARVAVGACSPVARRLADVERRLRGLPVGDTAALDAALEHALGDVEFPELSPIDDVRASAAYRLGVVGHLLRRAIRTAIPKEIRA